MSSKVRVLVVDDEAAILRFLGPVLAANDYDMAAAGTAADAIRLDLGLPDADGKDVIRRVREWTDVPIVVLSARDREAEKIEALDLGADDFINKPFGVGELLARMRAPPCHSCRRGSQAHAQGIRAFIISRPPCGKGHYAQADHVGRLGACPCAGYAISSGLRRSLAPKNRGQTR
jgi:two-component system KDP operon response regulator KdpE